jgi:rhodanese-related sulfurtransferase
MLVRSREDIYRMKDLKGKKIGLTKSLNVIKNDWWRIQEEYVFLGHEAMAVNIPVAFPKYIYDANKRKYSFEINPDFIDHVEELFNPDGMIVSMCRSGGRSAFAINMLAKAGFTNIYKIIDGYEGDMVDDPESVVHGKRMKNGWSNSSPWNYDLDHAKVWIPTGEELE